MRLEKDTAAQCARMAKIRFSPEEEVAYQLQLQNLFDWVKQLSEVDVSSVELSDFVQAAYLRPDEPIVNTALSQTLVKAFNEEKDNCAKVKKVL